MDVQPRADSVYRLSAAHVVRIVAPFEIVIGAAWIVLAILGLPRGWTEFLVAATIVVVVAGGLLFVRPPVVLRLTGDGYRIGFARSGGAVGARWREVESVRTGDAGDVAVLTFVLADGRRSTLPLSLLGPRRAEAQREVHERLNQAFGYRRF
jgi:hypothetical protein